MVAMMFLSTCICYMERVGFSLAYTAAAAEMGMDEASKGLILSAFFYGYVLSQVPGGWAAHRLGARRVLLAAFLLWSGVSAFTPTRATALIPVVIARFLIGVGQGLIFPAIHTILAQWVPPHQRSRAVSLTTSGMYLGAALAMLFLPPLLRLAGPHSVFLCEAAVGVAWALLWIIFSSEPPRSELAKASAAGFGVSFPVYMQPLPISSLEANVNSRSLDMKKRDAIPWRHIMLSLPVWAIVINNFTFHYALYVLMNWLPTYFSQGLGVSLENLGVSKMVPYLNMFIFSNIGGVIADYLIIRRILSVTRTRKVLNTGGFVAAALALFMMLGVRSPSTAIFLTSVCLGLCALSRAGFAVNHMDIAPRHAGILMGISNTAGTLAGIVGVGLTGWILESAKAKNIPMSDSKSWTMVFVTPALLCIFSAFIFLAFATGERIFD